jgi:hypothetical protein
MRPATKDALASIDVLTRSALAAGRALTSDERNGTALVMNSADVGRVFLRTDVRVDSGVTGDQFQRNLSALRAETRLAFGVRRPASAVRVTTRPSTRYAPPVVREWTTFLTSDAGVTFFGDSELVIRAVHDCKGDRAVCDAQPTECGHPPHVRTTDGRCGACVGAPGAVAAQAPTSSS